MSGEKTEQPPHRAQEGQAGGQSVAARTSAPVRALRPPASVLPKTLKSAIDHAHTLLDKCRR